MRSIKIFILNYKINNGTTLLERALGTMYVCVFVCEAQGNMIPFRRSASPWNGSSEFPDERINDVAAANAIHLRK